MHDVYLIDFDHYDHIYKNTPNPEGLSSATQFANTSQ